MYSTTPALQISIYSAYSDSVNISGAENDTVPVEVHIRNDYYENSTAAYLLILFFFDANFDMLKSVIFTQMPSGEVSIFVGFKSRWHTPFSCK
jgi:hypothetical protein